MKAFMLTALILIIAIGYFIAPGERPVVPAASHQPPRKEAPQTIDPNKLLKSIPPLRPESRKPADGISSVSPEPVEQNRPAVTAGANVAETPAPIVPVEPSLPAEFEEADEIIEKKIEQKAKAVLAALQAASSIKN